MGSSPSRAIFNPKYSPSVTSKSSIEAYFSAIVSIFSNCIFVSSSSSEIKLKTDSNSTSIVSPFITSTISLVLMSISTSSDLQPMRKIEKNNKVIINEI